MHAKGFHHMVAILSSQGLKKFSFAPLNLFPYMSTSGFGYKLFIFAHQHGRHMTKVNLVTIEHLSMQCF